MSTPIDPATAAALGLVQGLTEFLPVSSSGHVAIGAMFFGVEDFSLAMVVALHAGTLLATVAILRSDVRDLFMDCGRFFTSPRKTLRSDGGKTLVGIAAATVVTGALGLSLESTLEPWANSAWRIGSCLIITAIALLATRRQSGRAKQLPLWGYLLIGLAQGIAVAPGISRSGATIATAMLLGMSPPAAFRFSFLLSLPAIAGAVVLKLSDTSALMAIGSGGLIGGVVALISGAAALLLLRRLVSQGRLWTFSIYLVPLGVGLIIWDLLLT